MYGGAKKRGRRGLSWTSAKKLWPTRARPRGVVAVTGGAGVGFGAIWAGGFLFVEAAGGCKTVAGAYFRSR